MQSIVVKSDEFENSSPLYIFPLIPDYVAARSLRSLRSKNVKRKDDNVRKQSLRSSICGMVTRIEPLANSSCSKSRTKLISD